MAQHTLEKKICFLGFVPIFAPKNQKLFQRTGALLLFVGRKFIVCTYIDIKSTKEIWKRIDYPGIYYLFIFSIFLPG